MALQDLHISIDQDMHVTSLSSDEKPQLSTVVFIASDKTGARKTFTSIDEMERWILGRNGVSVEVRAAAGPSVGENVEN